MRSASGVATLVLQLVLLSLREAKPSAVLEPSQPKLSVLMGTAAKPHEFPWQLSLQVFVDDLFPYWMHGCGASLLSANYALTAAHCVDNEEGSDGHHQTPKFRVVAGLHNLTAGGVISNVSSYKMHERYKSSSTVSYNNDIAILELATPIHANGRTIKYASLPDNDDEQFAGRTCVITGWGLAGRSGSNIGYPQLLQKASIGVLSSASCHAERDNVDETQVCLHDELNEISSCFADSGGPLNCNYLTEHNSRQVVAGISSWVESKRYRDQWLCEPRGYSVYTRTSTYLQWIKKNTP